MFEKGAAAIRKLLKFCENHPETLPLDPLEPEDVKFSAEDVKEDMKNIAGAARNYKSED